MRSLRAILYMYVTLRFRTMDVYISRIKEKRFYLSQLTVAILRIIQYIQRKYMGNKYEPYPQTNTLTEITLNAKIT